MVDDVIVKKPVVLRMMVEDGLRALKGRTIETVKRHSHLVLFDFDAGTRVSVAPMLAGRFQLDPLLPKGDKQSKAVKLPKEIAASFRLGAALLRNG